MSDNHKHKRINAVRCKTCDTIIVSLGVHDFVWCNCPVGSDTRVAVDGGFDYYKRVGNLDNYVEVTIKTARG